jgi:hypothetical protein
MTSSVKDKSLKQEKAIAKKIKGTVVPASGAVKFSGFDVSTDKYCVEIKYTETEHYTLKYADLDKIRKIASTKGKRPLFIFEFMPEETKYVIISGVAGGTESCIEIKGKSMKFSKGTLETELTKSNYINVLWVNEQIGKFWTIQKWDNWVSQERLQNGNNGTTSSS